MDRERHRVESFPPRVTWGSDAFTRRSFLVSGAVTAAAAALTPTALAQTARRGRDIGPKFERIPTQFIAALADPEATSGNNAQLWGLWRRDPGPRGVALDRYERLKTAGVAPAGWRFDSAGWWLEEHGLIMEAPEFPLPPGQYMVTGNREAKSVLTVDPTSDDGAQRWALDGGVTLHDVTHLRCRSARYAPASSNGSCSPASARQSDFPVQPGAPMPPVSGCSKQDYSVLIVLAVAV